jgi:hypothetical protein
MKIDLLKKEFEMCGKLESGGKEETAQVSDPKTFY